MIASTSFFKVEEIKFERHTNGEHSWITFYFNNGRESFDVTAFVDDFRMPLKEILPEDV